MKSVVFYTWCDPCGRSTSHVTKSGRAHCMEHPGMIEFMLAPRLERVERRG